VGCFTDRIREGVYLQNDCSVNPISAKKLLLSYKIKIFLYKWQIQKDDIHISAFAVSSTTNNLKLHTSGARVWQFHNRLYPKAYWNARIPAGNKLIKWGPLEGIPI
jgi:hypothetical protein